MPRRPEVSRALVTFDSIVEAAERVLAADGAAVLTTNRVAEVAGVSVGSLYHYFPNKEAILSAVFDRYLERARDGFGRAMDEGTSIEDIGRRAAQVLFDMSAIERAVFGQLSRLRAAADAFDRLEAHDAELVARGAAALVRLGLMPEPEAREFAYTVVHAAEGILSAMSRHHDIDPERIAVVYVGLLRRYFADVR